VSWWGIPTRAGTHDTQGVNTDAAVGAVIRVAEELAAAQVLVFRVLGFWAEGI
jgi:hypothetical protein